MNGLKLYWPIPRVEFNGKGIGEAWLEEMEANGFQRTSSWTDADCAVFISDSQLDPQIIGKVPTVCYFWGWPPHRFLQQPEFQRHVQVQSTLMRGCTITVAASPCTADQAAMLGVYAPVLLAGVDSRLLDQAPKVFTKKPQVLFLSRLAEHKGLEELIDALSALSGDPVKLVISGPGDTTRFRKIAEDAGVNAEFHQFSDQEKLQAIVESTVLVHPSRHEGFGLPPLEALYLGTPVIARATPHNLWLLRGGAVYFDHIEGLVNILVAAFNGVPEFAELTKAGQKVARELTLANAAKSMAQVVHEAIREWCGKEMRDHPENKVAIYDRDHRRNWFYRVQYFDPGWYRHWRLQHVLKAIKGTTVLDVGASAGVYSVALAQAGYDVEWFDHSEEALNQAIALATKYNIPPDKLTYTVGDVHQMPYPDNVVDTVWAGEILEHVLDPATAFRECVRVARQRVIATTPVGRHHDDPLHLHHWNDQTISTLLQPYRDAGMSVTVDQIAEEGTEPSCYFIVVDKVQEET